MTITMKFGFYRVCRMNYFFRVLFVLLLVQNVSSFHNLIKLRKFLPNRRFYSMTPKSQADHNREKLKNFVKSIGIPLITSGIALTSALTARPFQTRAVDPLLVPPTPSRGFQTKSGLRYFDLYINPKYTQTPKYGQLVTFHYTIYYSPFNIKPPKLEIIDSTHYEIEPFLHKHGNSQIIRAIDDGLHTMRLGSRRRIFVPVNLAYTEPGIGPVPLDPFRRKKLNKILTQFEAGKGDLVIDLELMMIADDEADPGYYDDIPVDVEDTRKAIMKAMEENKNNGLLKDFGGNNGQDSVTGNELSRDAKRKENQSFKER